MLKNIDKKHFASLLCLLIFGILAVGSAEDESSSDPNAWKTSDNKSMAYIMMESFVKQRLKSPGSAEFPGVFDGKLDHVTSLGNQKYKILSYVDSQNSFGAMIRTKFIGVIVQTDSESWRLESLQLLE